MNQIKYVFKDGADLVPAIVGLYRLRERLEAEAAGEASPLAARGRGSMDGSQVVHHGGGPASTPAGGV